MDANYGVDLEAIFRVIDEAEVFIVRFALIDQRLLVDSRLDEAGAPFVRIVPPASSAEERYRYLRRERPGIALPEQITVFHWPRAVETMKEAGVWDRIEARMLALGGDAAALDVRRAYQDALRLHRADIVAAIRGGEGYETLWQRPAGS